MFDRAAAERLAVALDEDTAPPAITHAPGGKVTIGKPVGAPETASPPKPKLPTQNPAITLLATLQRDARLIDLIFENLDQYQDAQVGAAARPCLKQCRQSLERMVHISKLVDASENDLIDVDAHASAGQYRWVGEASSATNGQAKLIHPGWRVTATDMPVWAGAVEDADVIAPAQVTAG